MFFKLSCKLNFLLQEHTISLFLRSSKKYSLTFINNFPYINPLISAAHCWIASYNVALMFFQVHAVVGVLSDDADPMVTVMKLEKAPQESYADIGGLDQQIQEIKVNVSVFYILVNTAHLWHTHVKNNMV